MRWSSVLAAAWLMSVGIAETVAQDYRIYTRLSLEEQAEPVVGPQVIGRSLTIWHAGKVYDYLDNVNELVVYDPQQSRYTIVNGFHDLACTVEFGEIRQFLKVAQTQAEDYLAELADGDHPDAARAIAKTTFQLNPQFEFRADAERKILYCDNPQMSYHVHGVTAPNADVAAAFRQYADWASQLNFVLHGQTLMPAARMRVNAELEKQGWLPIRVELHLKDRRQTVLTAEHAIQWELGPTDRTHLMEWKNLQQRGELTFVSFQQYQKNVLEKLP